MRRFKIEIYGADSGFKNWEKKLADKKLEETHLISDVKLPNDEKSLKAIINEANGRITVWEGGVFIPLAFLVLGIALIGTAYQNFQIGKMMTTVILGNHCIQNACAMARNNRFPDQFFKKQFDERRRRYGICYRRQIFT